MTYSLFARTIFFLLNMFFIQYAPVRFEYLFEMPEIIQTILQHSFDKKTA